MLHGHLDGAARQRLRAGEHLRERAREQVVRAHAQERGRDLLAVARALQHQRALRVPAPARLEHRRGQQGLDQRLAGRGRLQVLEDFAQLEAVLGAEGEHDRFFVRRRLQLEPEADAELLAQGQAPGAVDLRSERRVHDELHAAALVEEALQHDPLLGGDGAQSLASGLDVFGDLKGRALRQGGTTCRLQERGGRVVVPRFLAQRGDLRRQLACATGRLPEPEGQGRRLAFRIGDAHDSRLHAQDPPRGVAELEDVSAVGLDRPVFVDRAHERPFGLLADLVVRGVGDGTTGEQRGHARALGGQEPAADAVTMEERAPALAVDADDLVQVFFSKVAIRPGPARQLEELRFQPLLGHAGRDHLLGEDVEGGRRLGCAVEDALADAAEERRRFDQLVQRQGEHPALRRLAERMTGAPHALEERRDGPGGADLDHEVHVADVDPELERRRGHDRAQASRLQSFLGVQSSLA